MKADLLFPCALALICLLTSSPARAEEPTYQEQLLKLEDKYVKLRIKKETAGVTLSESELIEFHRLHGEMLEFDPVGAFLDELLLNITAMIPIMEKHPEDLEFLKQFLANAASIQGLAQSLEQAKEYSDKLRQLFVRRDVKELERWSSELWKAAQEREKEKEKEKKQ